MQKQKYNSLSKDAKASLFKRFMAAYQDMADCFFDLGIDELGSHFDEGRLLFEGYLEDMGEALPTGTNKLAKSETLDVTSGHLVRTTRQDSKGSADADLPEIFKGMLADNLQMRQVDGLHGDDPSGGLGFKRHREDL